MTKTEEMHCINDAIEAVIDELKKEQEKYDRLVEQTPEPGTLRLYYINQASAYNNAVIIALHTKMQLLHRIHREISEEADRLLKEQDLG